jgi:hypothetical protein
VAALASDTTVADSEVRDRLRSLVAEHMQRKPPTRAQLVRNHLTLEIRPIRPLLSALMVLPWEATLRGITPCFRIHHMFANVVFDDFCNETVQRASARGCLLKDVQYLNQKK